MGVIAVIEKIIRLLYNADERLLRLMLLLLQESELDD